MEKGHTGAISAHRLFKAVGGALFVILAFWLLALPAFASAPPGELNDYRFAPSTEAVTSTGGAVDIGISENFACDGGSPSGELFINPQCNATGALGLFANVVCRIENLFGNVLALMYCAVQEAIVPPFLALLTLYVIIYGALVILGMVPHRLGEALMRVAKIGLVAVIALQADVAIRVAYTFYLSAAQTTISAVFSVFDDGQYQDHSEYQAMLEGGYILSPDYEDPSRRLYTGEHWMEGFDHVFNNVVNTLIAAGPLLITTLVILFFVCAPLFFMVVHLVISIFKALAEAIVSYLIALLMITLLFCLAPIFVSFALFRFTAGFFETWLKHLASYTLQMMIVFAFLMIMIMVDIFTFFAQVGDLFRSYAYDMQFGFLHKREVIPTLCRPVRDGPDKHTGNIVYYKFHTIAPDDHGSHVSDNESDMGPFGGFPKCIPEYRVDEVWGARALPDHLAGDVHMPPKLSRKQINDMIQDNRNYCESSPCYNLESGPFSGECRARKDALSSGDLTCGEIAREHTYNIIQQEVADANNNLHLPFMELVRTSDLIGFLLVRLLVVIILTWQLERFLKIVPGLAGHLAGTGFAGRLGGGEVEGADLMSHDKLDMETGFERFKASALKDGSKYRGSATGFVMGIGAAIAQSGRRTIARPSRFAARFGATSEVRGEASASNSIREERLKGTFGTSKPSHKPKGIRSGGRPTLGGEGKTPTNTRPTRRR